MAPSKQIKFKKGAKKSNNGTNKFVTKAFVKPPFPFEEYKNPELGRSNSVEFECKVDPTKTDSRTYKERILKFDSGTPVQYVKHREQLDKIIGSQGTIDVMQKIMLIKATYVGEALREWGNCILNLNIENENAITEGELVKIH